MTPHLRRVLIVEPDYVMRRTVALAAGRLALAEVHEAASLGAALARLRGCAYDAVVLALDAAPAADIRAFVGPLPSACRLVGMAGAGASPDIAQRPGAALTVVLRRPVRVKDLIAAALPVAPTDPWSVRPQAGDERRP